MTLVSRLAADPRSLADRILAGERAAVAAALNLLDDRRPAQRDQAASLLEALADVASGRQLIGLTGPPGVGKSSLASGLIGLWRRRGLRVGVLAVDPSSPLTGGALLGDRLRMLSQEPDLSDDVFIRSLASRGDQGGLAAEVWPMALVMLAAFDLVLIETVGVGQREIDVSRLADTTCFVVQPGSGDSVQFLKAGIMEVPHVLVVNKADLGATARKTLSDLRVTVGQRADADGWRIPVLAVSATQATGLDRLADTLADHHHWLAERDAFAVRRRRSQAEWVIGRLRDEFGRFGIDRLGGDARLTTDLAATVASPLRQHEDLRRRLLAGWRDGET